MSTNTLWLLVLSTLATGLPQTRALGADEMPPRAIARLGDYRFYHGPWIEGAVLSPDGSHVASVVTYPDYSRRVTDKERDPVEPVIFLWDAATGQRVRELRAPQSWVSLLAFSPDGKRLAAACGGSSDTFGVVVFAVDTGKLLWEQGKFKSVGFMQFSADGKELRVSEWLGPVSAWDAATGKQRRLWKPPPPTPPRKGEEGVCAVRGVLSPDGKVIVWEMGRTSDDGATSRDAAGLRVHDAETDRLLYQKKIALFRRLFGFAFSPDGKRFAADSDKLTVWETSTGKEQAALKVPKLIAWFVLAPDWRRALICEEDSRVSLWDLETGKRERDLGFVCSSHYSLETPQAFSADGKTVLFATETTLRLFDATTGKERAASGHSAPVTPRFSADGRTLFTSCAERRCSWDASSGNEPVLLTRELRKSWEVGALGRSADDRLLLDAPERRVRVREAATGRVLRELENEAFVDFGLFSPNAARVLLWHPSANDKKPDQYPEMFRLYDAGIGKTSGEFKFKSFDMVRGAVFSPDARIVAWADRDNAVHLHDAVTGKVVRTLRSSLPLPKDRCDEVSLVFSPDGEHLLVTASLHEFKRGKFDERTTLPLRMFDVSSGRETGRFYADTEKATKGYKLSCAAFSPDGRLLAVGEEKSGTVRLIELASGKVRGEFARHRDGVHALAFAPDGKTLASGGEDNVVFLWDVTGARTAAAPKKASETDLAAWWADLAAEDARRAGDAAASLMRRPDQGVALLADRLRPAEAPDAKRLARLIADLDADDFKAREAASDELARFGDRAEAALRRALKDGPSPETRRRVEDLLGLLEPGPPPPETLRALRAIEALEHLGTPEAKRCLEAQAKGAPEARQTRDAKAALERLASRR